MFSVLLLHWLPVDINFSSLRSFANDRERFVVTIHDIKALYSASFFQ